MSTQGIATKVHNNVEESSISFSYNSERVPKKQKFCRTAESITVIRAAGTFFPENCNGTSSNDLIQKSPDIIQENQSILTYGCDVAENLSLKDRTEINVTNTSASSASLLTTTTRSSSVLPQIYSALQMQQQLFTFYQQIAFMMATFSHLQPSLTATDSPHTTLPSITSTDLLQNKHLINMIFNLQKARLQQNNYGEPCISGIKSDPPCLRQLCKKSSLSTAITRTTKDNNRSQNITIPQGHCGSVGRTTCGYLRFRFSEDCGFENCGYRRHQSHFHCNRPDCQYSFCDKARFVQHTARHERLDTLLGCDFQQYRAAVICNYSHCPYALSMTGDLNYIINNRKSSHFHCLKCPFVCADTNKVVAHRRLHSQMEFVRLAGFRKVYSKENCKATNSSSKKDKQITNVAPSTKFKEHSDHINKEITPSHCPYAMRHTHYHCLICDCSVLSKSQLLHHKHFKSVTYSTTRLQALTKNKSQEVRNEFECSTSKRLS